MKKILLLIMLLFIITNCKDIFNANDIGNFKIINKSDKVIEFVWIAPEGEFFPTAKSIDIGTDQVFEKQGLQSGKYDIAIDFKDEYNSYNSKKDKNLCLFIEKGLTTIWYVNSDGNIKTEQ